MPDARTGRAAEPNAAPWAQPADEVLRVLGTSADGLSEAEAAGRLAEHGPNALAARDQDHWTMLLLRQFANPLVYLLIGAAFVKAYFKGAVDAAVIGAVLLLMAGIGFAQELKARRAMDALLKLSAPKSKVRRGGRTGLLDSRSIVPGDILVLETGDRVGADARLIEVANLRINESALTGESMPVEKSSRPAAAEAAIHDRLNMVFMGTAVSHGRGTAVATGTGMRTEIGRIADAIRGARKDKTPLQKSVDKLGHTIIWVVATACAMLAAAGLLHNMSGVEVMLLAVAAAVSGIPEGLPAAVTVVLAICVSRMAGRQVIIRKLTAVETLGTATVICSDKTGTLTLNQMTVREIWTPSGAVSVAGIGYEPSGAFSRDGRAVEPGADPALTRLLRVGALCNDAMLDRTAAGWEILGDPTEGALVAVAAKAGLAKARLEEEQPRLDEIPFESEKQYMATLHAEQGRRTVYVKGSVERVLDLCGDPSRPDAGQPLDENSRRAALEANARLAGQGLRVLALAAGPYPIELGKLNPARFKGRLELLGLIGMMDPPREEARQAIQACRQAGIRVVMITGDNPLTASAIAAQLGLAQPGDQAVSGRELEAMDDDALLAACRTHTVFARIEPLHKLRIVKAFQRAGHVAAMTGDGVNDAPALEAAGIGVAMGLTGTDVAKEASDMILADDNFASIVAAVEEGRIVFNRLRNVVFFLLMTCAAELLTLFLSVAFYGESPLEPIQILWINLVTGALVAIPLGLEPGAGNELRQPPRDPRVGLIYPGMLWRLGLTGAAVSLLVAWVFHHAPLPAEADPETTHALRQTMAFTGLVIFEWLFAFHARSPDRGILKIGLFRNPWLLACMAVGLGLQVLVVYLPAANRLFHTRPLTAEEWVWTLLPGAALTAAESLRKRFAPAWFSRGQWQLPD
jgi:Ca2+-transporting ATPase